MTTNTNAAQVANNLIAVAEDQAFEAWYKQDCLVGGVNARIAARAAWNARAALTTAAAVPPEGVVMVPVELAERVQESLGEFLMDHGWSQRDMDTSDDFGAVLLAAAPKEEPVPAGEYPPLPGASLWRDETGIRGYGTDPGTGPWYTADQLRAYADTTCAMRAQGAPVAQGGPIGYLAAYEVDRLKQGHDGHLRSPKFGPSPLDSDVPVYLGPLPTAGATDPWREHLADQADMIDCVTLQRAMVKHGISFPDGGMEHFRAALGAMVNRFVLHAAPTTQAAPVAQGDALTDTYVQQVPDKCDRIVWRGRYYHLPIDAAEHSYTEPSPMAKVAAALRQKAEQEDAAYQARRSDQGLMESEWGPMEDAPPHEDPPMHVAVVEGDDTVRTLQWNRDVAAFAYPAGTLLYAARSQPTPPAVVEPMTDEQIDTAIQQHGDPVATYRKLHDFARAIEAAHGIGIKKENGNG